MSRSIVISSFVEDGLGRWRAGVEEPIRAAVLAEFADRLRTASWFGRVRLAFAIEREVERRLAEVSPPSAEALF